MNGLIFDIKRYAIHDGPGIRTTVFFKGCPLRCCWCHNPEGLSPQPQIVYRQDRCIGCKACVRTCPQNALTLTAQGVLTDTAHCRACGTCAQVCPAEARQAVGWPTGIESLIQAIEKDVPFYDQSGGGVTFSGGEPLFQASFLIELLTACGRRDIHRVVDTTGYAHRDTLAAVASRTDLFLFDLKLMDPARHKRFTGVSNRKIRQNLKWLAHQEIDLVVRIPLIPGINDGHRNIDQCGAFIAGLGSVDRVDLLPYHQSSRGKYEKLRIDYRADRIRPPRPRKIEAVARRLAAFGLRVHTGG